VGKTWWKYPDRPTERQMARQTDRQTDRPGCGNPLRDRLTDPARDVDAALLALIVAGGLGAVADGALDLLAG